MCLSANREGKKHPESEELCPGKDAERDVRATVGRELNLMGAVMGSRKAEQRDGSHFSVQLTGNRGCAWLCGPAETTSTTESKESGLG